jgi:hypothetical protein
MLFVSSTLLFLVNAVTLRREFTLFRITYYKLLYSGIIEYNIGIGIYRGLFLTTSIRHSFNLFIRDIVAIVLQLTAFYLGSVLLIASSALSKYTDSSLERYKKKLISKMGEQSVVLEYPLIILFIHLIGVIL